jgi:predicted dehydrogenase
MSSKIRIAVIGCGYWGPNLIRNFRGHGDVCEVVSVCDRDAQRLNHMQAIFPDVEVTGDVESIIHNVNIDAVGIVTPVSAHYDLARRCLLSGKHVFVEKPMASSAAECEELVRLSEELGLTLMVGHTFIHSAPVRHIAEMIRSGDLGEIYYINSRRLNLGLFQHDINVAWDLAPHDLSIILHLLQKMPIAVNCQGKNHLNGKEDVVNISLDFDGGAFAMIQSSWLDPNKVREMIVIGSKRMVVYDDTRPNEKIRIYDKRVEAPPHYDTFAEFHFSYHYGDMTAPFIHQTEPLKIETRNFLDCIATGEIPVTSGYDGLNVVRILEATTESLRRGGGRVEIPGGLATPSHDAVFGGMRVGLAS